MQTYKEFLQKHKKIVIPIAVILLLAILIGIVCAVFLNRKPETAAVQVESQTTSVQTGAQSGGVSENAASVQPDTAQTAEPQARSNAASGQAAVGDGFEAQENTAPGGNSGGNSGAGSTASAGTHTHQWVAHTSQVWVSNIVTVVDTPAQTVHGARFYTMQSDGTYIANGPTYWFENGFTRDDLKSIIREGIKNADENGLYNGVYYGNYQNVTKEIPAVTHTEDQGHYETQTDYAYCSICGQRR